MKADTAQRTTRDDNDNDVNAPPSSTPRRWLITGVSTGLGRALALSCLEIGDTVIGTLRNSEQAREFENLAPGRSIAVLLDVTDDETLRTEVPAAIERAGGVDTLVNNAGYSLIGAVEETSLDEARHMMDTNFFAAVNLTQVVLPYLRAQERGHIINVASVASTIGFAWSAMYSASKSALAAMTEALADEVSSFGIKVTCIEPGGMRTNFASTSLAIVERPLPHYSDSIGEVQRQYQAAATKMRNDPIKSAQVVRALVQMPDPPRRLAIGTDGHSMIVNALQRRLEDYERNRGNASDTAFTV
ncbi:SDR family NAD(P)-dependent oxidoreductase [Rhodococcus rhodochrous]|uniref:SDR family NAD(P)-dependent oxidoreductase n=1 Tax=Rhodococcus rhodochrous TaxID=1829 RepID=UPI0006C84569|nr:SDR family NAD(P)-dependent oxidoreductase [Rhodococcus rhodochrous]